MFTRRQLLNTTSAVRIGRCTFTKRTMSSLDVHPNEVTKPENFQLVIVGTGWAGYQMFTQCRKHLVDIEEKAGRPVDLIVVSKRNVRLDFCANYQVMIHELSFFFNYR